MKKKLMVICAALLGLQVQASLKIALAGALVPAAALVNFAYLASIASSVNADKKVRELEERLNFNGKYMSAEKSSPKFCVNYFMASLH